MPDPSPTAPTPEASTSLKEALALFASIVLPMFLAIIDQTIVAAALPAIAADLGNAERVSWVVIAYLAATTISAPVYGRLGDLLGRRRLMLVALTIMMVATVLCGVAQSVEQLTAARVLQGLGGGGLMTLSQALIGETMPPRDRAKYQGFLATIAVSSSAFGAVAGGLLTQYFGWRSVFFVGVPIGLVAVLLVRRLPARSGTESRVRFDTAGFVLFSVFITALLLMLHNLQDFNVQVLPIAGLLLVVSVVAVVLLVLCEQRAVDPLLPIPLLGQPAVWRSDALAACHGGVFVSLLTFLPIYLRVVHGAASDRIGLIILPVAAGVAVGSMTTGWLVSRTGRTAVFPSLGLGIVVACLLGLAMWSPQLGLWPLTILLAVTSLFMGTVMSVVQVTVQAATGAAGLGTGAASVQFSRSLGSAIGTAIVGAAFFISLTTSDPGAARLFATIIQDGPAALNALPQAGHLAIAGEIANAFRVAFLAMAVLAGGALAFAWSLPLRRL